MKFDRESFDVVIKHFNDEKQYFCDVKTDSSHPNMFVMEFLDGYTRSFNYRVIKELFISNHHRTEN